MSGNAKQRITLTNLSEPQQMRELNRQLTWIWDQLLGGLSMKSLNAGMQAVIDSKASCEEVDELTGAVIRQNTQLIQTAKEIALKADQSEVDELGSLVSETAAELSVQHDLISGKVSQTDFDAMGSRVSDAESMLALQADQITAKVDRTEFDELGKTVASNSSLITQTAEEIETKVSQTEFDELGARVGEAESRISQTAEEIETKVSRTEFDELGETVAGHTTSITQNAEQIELKANKGDPASAVDTGAGIVIDAEGVVVSGGQIDLRTNAGDQYLSITSEAISASSMDAPNVAPRYDGPAAITVNSAATSAQIATGSYYLSLMQVLKALSGKYLPYDVTISVLTDGYGKAELAGVQGTGSITINGNGHGQYGALRLAQNGVYIKVNELKVTRMATVGTAWAVLVTACAYVELLWCAVDGNGAADALYLSEGSKAWVRECEFYGTTGSTLITAQYCVDLTVLNAKGGNAAYFAYTDGATVKWSGTRPDGTWSQGNTSLTAPADLSSLTVDSGDAPATAPTLKTATYSMQYADTYARGNVASWDYPDGSPNNDIYQGYTGHAGRISGCMWFGNTTLRSALSGKTIRQASLRLTAQRFVGTGRAVQVQLYGTATEYATRSGAPTLTKNYGIIGSATPGETAEITIPAGVITDLVAGTINGLMLYSADTANYEERNYSENYARFDGSTGGDSTTRPRLTVMYEG